MKRLLRTSCRALAVVLLAALLASCNREDLAGTARPPKAEAKPPPPKCNLYTPASKDLKVKINEAMVENTKTIADEFGKFPAWIELMNPTEEVVNLGEMALSDSLSQPKKWLMPCDERSLIAAHGYLIVFADGGPPKDPNSQFIHSPLTLERKEDFVLTLNQGSNNLRFDTSEIGADESVGRLPDGGTKTVEMAEPTPGAENKEPTPAPGGGKFVRGDASANGKVNVSDMALLLRIVFASEPGPPCKDRLDVDDNGQIELADAIALRDYLFFHASPPPPPFPQEGVDPTSDALPCPAE